MAVLHRLQWIDAQIRAGNYPNTRSLAAEFEISRRQALRDFDYLRDSLGAPLEYSALRRGYYYTDQVFTLPGPYVTPNQRSMLSALGDYYARLAGQGRAYADMAELFQRLGAPAAAGGGGGPAASAVLAPFRAVLRGNAGHVPASLRPFVRGTTPDGGLACEFHQPDPFVAALLNGGIMRVEFPGWLRERVLARLQSWQNANQIDDMTRHVTPITVPSAQQLTRRSQNMATRQRIEARMGMGWTSYVGALAGVLRAAGMSELSETQLMGLTGMAFHLIVEENLCVSGPTVYPWVEEHLAGLERMGILAEVYQAMPDSPVYEAARRRAVTNIKAAIDRGVGVALWGVDTGEFGIVNGYDDADGVFLMSGCFDHGPEGSAPLLYENLGRSFEGAPILHYVIPVERVPFDPARAYTESLRFYVDQMEREFHMSPNYRSGLLAYRNWERALAGGNYNPRGLRYITFVYGEAKQDAAAYLNWLVEAWNGLPGLEAVAAQFGRIAGVYARMMSALGQEFDKPYMLEAPVAPEQAAALLPLVREAADLEAEAVALVKRALAGGK